MKFTIVLIIIIAGYEICAQVNLPRPITKTVSDKVIPLSDRLRELKKHATETLEDPSLRDLPSAAPLLNTPILTTLLSQTGEVLIEEEFDADGQLAIAREWVIYGTNADEALLRNANVTFVEKQILSQLGVVVYRIKVPQQLNDMSKLRVVLPNHLGSQLARNHVYLSQSEQFDTNQQKPNKTSSSALPSAKRFMCYGRPSVGMLDTRLDIDHSVFASMSVEQEDFSIELTPQNDAHGTAVAGILAQQLPHASKIFSAAVFYQRSNVSQGATLMSLLKGLNWLAKQSVSVINLSLTGPQNPLLESALRQLAAQDIILVAAAGNFGPSAPPVYPAGYSETIAVTAIDNNQKVYRWANQGDYITFAAPGVSVLTARQNNQWGHETGTSMATPIVTARLACLKSRNDNEVVTQLIDEAVDIGKPGKDPVYGYGAILP